MIVKQISNSTIKDVLLSLIECTKRAIENGGGFGWVAVPLDDALANHWKMVAQTNTILLFVAISKNEVVGSVQLVLPALKNEAGNFAGEISTLFVHPDHRKKGIADKLLCAAEEQAVIRNLQQLNLDVRETQEVALRLYLRHGFEIWGKKPRYARINSEYLAGYFLSKYLIP